MLNSQTHCTPQCLHEVFLKYSRDAVEPSLEVWEYNSQIRKSQESSFRAALG